MMSINETVAELRELRRMADEIAEEINALTDTIKNHMEAAQIDVLSGLDWKATYKTVTTQRIDTAAIKKQMPDIAAKFTKTIESKRFTLV